MPQLQYTIPPELDGKTVHSCALQGLKMSNGLFKRAKFQGKVLLNGLPVLANQKVEAGQVLFLDIPDKENTLPEQSELKLIPVFEDEHFMIVNKPAPLPTACSARQEGQTLENVVYSYLGSPSSFVYRPVNRLDKGTSGLMLVAKTAYSQNLLQKNLHTQNFVREYLAVCEGVPEKAEGWIDLPIAKAEGSTVRREVREDGKPARTHYHVLASTGKRSLFRLRLDTGRTHQIRVHLSAIGCPVCGDFLYGTELQTIPGRFALHSAYVKVLHPVTGEWIEREAPLPTELEDLLVPNEE